MLERPIKPSSSPRNLIRSFQQVDHTYTSNLPPAFTAAWTKASTSVPIVTFVFTKIPLFSPYRRHITSSVGVPASSAIKCDLGVDFKSAQTTRRVPWAAKARAIARPRPDDEPVTMHTLSLRRAPVGKLGVNEAIAHGGKQVFRYFLL